LGLLIDYDFRKKNDFFNIIYKNKKNMRYIKTYESFRSTQHINEELIGGLLNKLKNFVKDSFSKGFSNLFGSAKDVDKIIEEYLSKVRSISTNKKLALEKYGEYINKVKSGEEVSEEENAELKKNLTTAKTNFDKQLALLKREFDIKFNEIMTDEKNPKIKNYLTLKKLEMERELLNDDLKYLLGDNNPEELKSKIEDPDVLSIIEDIEKRYENNTKNIEGQVRELKEKGEENLEFDVELAKRKATEGGEPYVWENSPFPNYTFKKDDKIKYFSMANKDVVSGVVVEDSTDDDVRVKTDKGTWRVKKSAVVSSENYDKANNPPANTPANTTTNTPNTTTTTI
jgi:hypothetical protein